MTLAKLTILPELGLPVVALFNPQEISVSKSVHWRRIPVAESDVMRAQFTHGEPARRCVRSVESGAGAWMR